MKGSPPTPAGAIERAEEVGARLHRLAASTPVNEQLRDELRARLVAQPAAGQAAARSRRAGRAPVIWRARALLAACTAVVVLVAAVLLFTGSNIATARSVEALASAELLRLTDYNGFLSVASAGERIVVEKNEGLWFLLPSGSTQALYEPPRGTYARMPAVSPDGKRVAFAHSQPGSGTGISIIGIDGQGVARVTVPASEMVYDSFPAWSPDGAKLAFARAELVGMRPVTMVETVMLLDLAGGEPVEFARGSHPTWSPDGQHLAYSRPLEGTDGGLASTELVVARADGKGAARVLGRGDEPTWSPSGQFVAYAAVEVHERVLRAHPDGSPWLVVQEWSREIWAVNVLSGERFQLTASTPAPRFDLAAWQRDAEAEGPPAEGQVVAVVEGDSSDWGPAWSRDGRTLLFIRSAQSSWVSMARFSVCQLTLRFR